MRARKRDEGEQAERSEAGSPPAERTGDAVRRRRARTSTAGDRASEDRPESERGRTRERDEGDGGRTRQRGSTATRSRADDDRAGSDEGGQAGARPTRRGSRRRGSGARGGSSRAGGDGGKGGKGDAGGRAGGATKGGKGGKASKGGKGGNDGGQGGKGGQGRGRSSQGNRNQRQRKKGVGFWGETPKLPDVETDVRITNDPDAVPRSLGPPPLPGHETIAEHYFGVVYHRAVTTAGALAAAGGLIDPATLSDEIES